MPLGLTSVEITGMVRDIVLITFFVISTVVVIIAAVLGIKLYNRTSRLVDRADRTVARVQSMVGSVESTATTVRKAAVAVNLGAHAGSFARTVTDTVFRRGDSAKDRNGNVPDSREAASKS